MKEIMRKIHLTNFNKITRTINAEALIQSAKIEATTTATTTTTTSAMMKVRKGERRPQFGPTMR